MSLLIDSKRPTRALRICFDKVFDKVVVDIANP